MKWIFILFMHVLFCGGMPRQDQIRYAILIYNIIETIRKQGSYLFTCDLTDLIITPPPIVFLVLIL